MQENEQSSAACRVQAPQAVDRQQGDYVYDFGGCFGKICLPAGRHRLLANPDAAVHEGPCCDDGRSAAKGDAKEGFDTPNFPVGVQV